MLAASTSSRGFVARILWLAAVQGSATTLRKRAEGQRPKPALLGERLVSAKAAYPCQTLDCLPNRLSGRRLLGSLADKRLSGADFGKGYRHGNLGRATS